MIAIQMTQFETLTLSPNAPHNKQEISPTNESRIRNWWDRDVGYGERKESGILARDQLINLQNRRSLLYDSLWPVKRG